MPLRINLLGSFHLLVDRTQVDVARPQVRHLLALLALRPGQPVDTAALAEQLWWGASAPADEIAALRVMASRARALLGERSELLRTGRGTYALDAATDVAAFDALLGEARAAAGPSDEDDRRDRALAIWRGTPCSDVQESPWIADARWRLEADHVQLVSTRSASLLSSGRNEDALALAAPMGRDHPTDESLTIVISSALAALGRRTEALEVVASTTRALRSVTGLEPSAQLRAHELDLLRSTDTAIPLRPPMAPSSAPAPLLVVGRAAERRCLLDPTFRVLVLRGEPGIGKTTLVEETARVLEADGRPAVSVAAASHSPRPMDLVAGLLDQLGAGDAVTQPARALSRDHLLDDLAGRIVGHTDGATLLIDDAHWLDLTSAAVLQRVVAHGTVRLILATRPDPSPGLAALLEQVAPDLEIDLAGFTLDETTTYLLHALGERAHAMAAAMHARAGGNPLFLSLLADDATETAPSQDEVPSNVLMAARHRIDVLSLRGRQTLAIASVLAPSIPLGVLGAAVPSAYADLEEAETAGLVTLDRVAGRAHFVHALIAEATYRMLSEGDRITWHDHLSRILQSSDGPPVEVAIHAWEAREIDPQRAAATCSRAAEAHRLLYDWEECLRWAERGRGLLAPDAPARLRAELAAHCGRAQRRLMLDSAPALLEAADLAADLDDPDLYGEIVDELCSHGSTTQTATVHEQALAHLERALASETSASVRARVLASASALYSNTIRTEEGRDRFLEALALCDRADAHTQVEVLLHSHLGLCSPLDGDLRLQSAARLESLAPGDPDARWEAAFLRFGVATATGNRPEADRTIDALRTLTPKVRLRNRDLGHAFSEVAYAIHIGELDEASRWTDRVLHLGAGYPPSWITIIYAGSLLATRHAQGRLAETHPFVLDLVAGTPEEYATYRGILAGTAAAAGDTEVARRELEALKPAGFERIKTNDLPACFVLTMVADAAVHVGDTEAAASLIVRLEPMEHLFAWSGVATHRPVAAHLAELHDLLGQDEASQRARRIADRLLSGRRRSGAGA